MNIIRNSHGMHFVYNLSLIFYKIVIEFIQFKNFFPYSNTIPWKISVRKYCDHYKAMVFIRLIYSHKLIFPSLSYSYPLVQRTQSTRSPKGSSIFHTSIVIGCQIQLFVPCWTWVEWPYPSMLWCKPARFNFAVRVRNTFLLR